MQLSVVQDIGVPFLHNVILVSMLYMSDPANHIFKHIEAPVRTADLIKRTLISNAGKDGGKMD